MTLTIKHELTEDDESFIKDVVLNVDLFLPGYCGYWLRGERHTANGWIASYEYSGADARRGRNAHRLISRAFALKVLTEGIKAHGVKFASDYDGPTLDCAVQMAMFHKVVFG